MFLWWIGNIILIVVVFPVVLLLLNRILGAIEDIRFTIDDIYNNAADLYDLLDGVPDMLAETDETVGEINVGALRYAQGLQQLLARS